MLRAASLMLLFAIPATAAPPVIEVKGGKTDQTNVVVTAPLPKDAGAGVNVVELPNGQHAAAQVGSASLFATDPKSQYLTFVLPKLAAGQTVSVRPGTLNYIKPQPQFAFTDKKGEYTDLAFNKQPVLRFKNAPHDTSTPDKHALTFKPFHQVFDPEKGETLLSSDAYTWTDKTVLFPHHRGLFFGFAKISYGDKKGIDTWHGRKNEFTEHEKVLLREAGEVFGRERDAISWNGQSKDRFADEQREVTVYRVPGGTLIDWSSTISTTQDKVTLDGDPQHAGFHFRATQEVSQKTKGETYYLRPDGKDAPGKTRNWDPKGNDPRTLNIPWSAMSFVTGGKRYTALRINSPLNPKDARGSERDYGRFGDYFVYDITPTTPLKVRYRVWVQEGELTVEQAAAMADAFVNPPTVAVIAK